MSTFAYHTHKLRLMLKLDAPESKDEEHGSPTEAHGDSKGDHGSIMHSIRDSEVDDMSIYLESQPEIVKVCYTQNDLIHDSQNVSVRNYNAKEHFREKVRRYWNFFSTSGSWPRSTFSHRYASLTLLIPRAIKPGGP